MHAGLVDPEDLAVDGGAREGRHAAARADPDRPFDPPDGQFHPDHRTDVTGDPAAGQVVGGMCHFSEKAHEA